MHICQCLKCQFYLSNCEKIVQKKSKRVLLKIRKQFKAHKKLYKNCMVLKNMWNKYLV